MAQANRAQIVGCAELQSEALSRRLRPRATGLGASTWSQIKSILAHSVGSQVIHSYLRVRSKLSTTACRCEVLCLWVRSTLLVGAKHLDTCMCEVFGFCDLRSDFFLGVFFPHDSELGNQECRAERELATPPLPPLLEIVFFLGNPRGPDLWKQ